MRLRSIEIKNFGCIGDPGYSVEIDNIVVLIGKNNVGKSTILDAYEALAGTGSPLSISAFHNRDKALAVQVSAVFADLSEQDYTLSLQTLFRL